MSPDTEAVHLALQVNAGEDADADDLDHLTRQLRDELQDMDLESVQLVRDQAARAGTKSGEAMVTLGALALQVLPAAISTLIGFLQVWVQRGQNRTLKIKTQVGDRAVEVEYSPRATSEEELKRLVETLTGALGQKTS